MTVTLADIETARRSIGAQVLRTPMLPAPKLSALTGAQVWVKYENLQVTNSFKERGALNKLAALSADERARGVIAMRVARSSGALCAGVSTARRRAPVSIGRPYLIAITVLRRAFFYSFRPGSASRQAARSMAISASRLSLSRKMEATASVLPSRR